jgi:hypothetical protein
LGYTIFPKTRGLTSSFGCKIGDLNEVPHRRPAIPKYPVHPGLMCGFMIIMFMPETLGAGLCNEVYKEIRHPIFLHAF